MGSATFAAGSPRPDHHHHARPAFPGPASIHAAAHYLSSRVGRTSFAVADTHGKVSGAHVQRRFLSASVVKAMLLVAYLDRPSVAHRDLDDRDRALLNPMITVSDNDAATEVRSIVGNSGLSALAHRVGMTSFETAAIWGDSHITQVPG
jgi:hypothetical protein